MKKHILNLGIIQLYETDRRITLKFVGIRISLVKNITGLQYFKERANFGDQLNIDLFSFFNKSTQNDSCIMLAIGSLLDSFLLKKRKRKRKTPIIVYGTGFIKDKTKKDVFAYPLKVYACRGYNTLERLKQADDVQIVDNVVVADPGILVSKIFDTKEIKKKYKLGIIPHYVDKDSALLNKIKVTNSVVLDICEDPKILVKKIAECECIISSAMHGLIAADSLGIPNIRMIVTDKLTGGDYKFDDYYSAFGISNHNRINLNEQDVTDEDLPFIISHYKITRDKVAEMQKKLINIFPF